MRKYVLLPFILPSFLVGYACVALFTAIFAAHKLKLAGWVLEAQWRPWAAKRWHYSTTFGQAVIYHPDHLLRVAGLPSRLEMHEHVHVRQNQDYAVLAFILALFCLPSWGKALAVWIIGSSLWFAVNALTALLRGGDPYRDSEHERAAYAQTDLIEISQVGKDWLETRG